MEIRLTTANIFEHTCVYSNYKKHAMNNFTCMHRDIVEGDETVCIDCGLVLSTTIHFYETINGRKFTEFDDYMHPEFQEEPVNFIEMLHFDDKGKIIPGNGKRIFDKSSTNKASKGKMYYDTLRMTRMFNPGQQDYYYNHVLSEAFSIMPFLNTYDITDKRYLNMLCLALCKTYLKYEQTQTQKTKFLQVCSEYTGYSLSKVNALLGSTFN